MAVVEGAIDSVRLAAAGKGIQLQRLLDSGVGPTSGDPERLQQVVWNLLSNAIKFTPKGGRVQVRLERADSNVDIVVSDTGIGISPEFLPHVFERFRQGDGSTARKHTGLGLGLAIASQLVELHGGTIRVESQGKGHGATFSVSLPLTAVVATRPQLTGRRPSLADLELHAGFLEGVRVLVVEDEPDAREVLGLILNQYGAQVICVGTAAEAFSLLSKHDPVDVLISDIDMPGEDGYSLLRRVRSMEALHGRTRIPAAALTAYGRTEDRMQALSAGFQIHVPKPVEPAELLAVVASLTGRASELQARI
jgi:CheY-like chemotaxis protein/anti-sigma regulatory factor (Ser/Thr protein kinase)